MKPNADHPQPGRSPAEAESTAQEDHIDEIARPTDRRGQAAEAATNQPLCVREAITLVHESTRAAFESFRVARSHQERAHDSIQRGHEALVKTCKWIARLCEYLRDR